MRGTYICAQATRGHLCQTSDDVYFRGDPPRVLHHEGGGGLLRCNGSPNVNLAKQDFEVMPGPSGDAAAIRCQGRRNETSRVCWAHLEGRRTTHQRPVINIEAPLTHREEFRSSHGALVLLRQPRSGILRSPRTLCSEFQSLLLFFFSITHLPNTPGLILRCIRLPITC